MESKATKQRSNKLNRAVVPLLAMPANKAKILELSGFDAGGSAPEELRAQQGRARFVRAGGHADETAAAVSD
ncbi:MAG TPA: hypothetical protein VN667_09070 [Burkholderiales bacterium]|nr:hypothetical protein [Burkholderiales bacterium]